MEITLNKHVKWREEENVLLICDCKKLRDFQISLKYKDFMIKIFRGLKAEDLNEEEKKVLSDFEKTNLLSSLKTRKLTKKDFPKAMNLLDRELGKDRVRSEEFLKKKYEEHSDLFLGLYLDNEIVGFICGFPREDYLLMSEIAVDSRFHGRGFGKRLVKEFEKTAKKKGFKKINVGSEDKSVGFYKSLGYSPFLLIQFENNSYSKEDFDNLDILDYKDGFIKINVKDPSLDHINMLRNKYPKAHFQYIFTKQLEKK